MEYKKKSYTLPITVVILVAILIIFIVIYFVVNNIHTVPTRTDELLPIGREKGEII